MMPLDPFGDSQFDLDPFRGLDPFGSSRHARFPALPDEQARGVLERLASGTISGIGYAGSVLDKTFGARALRGLAAGDPRELLSVVPFSDTLGLTDFEQSKGHPMEDLLTGHNALGLQVLPENDPTRWEARDFVSLPLEILADPATYLMPGASTAAGKLAKAAGVMPRGLRAGLEGFHLLEPEVLAAQHALGKTAEEAAAHVQFLRDAGRRVAPTALVDAAAQAGVDLKPGTSLRSLAGVGLPFGEAQAFLGTGKAGLGVLDAGAALYRGAKQTPGLGQAIGLGEWGAKTAAPVGRHLRAWFDDRVGGATNALAQTAAAEHAFPAAVKGTAAAKEFGDTLRRTLEPEVQRAVASGVPGAELNLLQSTRAATENVHPAVQRLLGLQAGQVPGAAVPEVQQAAGLARAEFDRQAAEAARLGIPIGVMEDYAARQRLRLPGETPTGVMTDKEKLFSPAQGAARQRKEYLSGWEGSTGAVESYATDPLIAGPGRLKPQKAARRIMTQEEERKITAGKLLTLTPEWATERGSSARQLAKALKTHDPGLPFYEPDFATAAEGRSLAHHARAVPAAQGFYGAIREGAVPLAELPKAAQATAISAWDALKKSGLRTKAIRDPQGNIVAREGAMVEALRALTPRHGIPAEELARAANFPQARAILKSHFLKKEDAEAVTKAMQMWTTPHEIEGARNFFDRATALIKTHLYSVWPTSQVRNVGDNLYKNFLDSIPLESHDLAAKIMTGKADPAVAQDWIRRAFVHGAAFSGNTSLDDLAGRVERLSTGTGRISRELPGATIRSTGSVPKDLANLVREGLDLRDPATGKLSIRRSPLNMVSVPGVVKPENVQNQWVQAVQRAGQNAEDWTRLANFIGNVKKGMGDAQAAARTNLVHVDYSRLSRFERSVMRRAIPFYAFSKGNIPFYLSESLRKPSRIAATLRTALHAQGEGYVPDYLQSGVAIPLGDVQQGPLGEQTQRYLSSTGLSFEDAFSRLRIAPTPGAALGNTLRGLAGELNPLAKVPMELLSGTQLHTGRRLEDLHPNRLVASLVADPTLAQNLSEVAANSPFARYLSMGQGLADPRKGVGPRALNFLTGLRQTDVDIGRTQAAEERRKVETLLAQNPAFSKFVEFTPRPDEVKNLAPEAVEQLRVYNWLRAQAREAAQKRRQMEALAGAP